MFPPCDPNLTPTHQQKVIFQLSLYSGLQIGPGKDAEEKLYQKILKALKENESQIGQWDVVWGPSLVQLNSHLFPINAMYMARQRNTSNYVIAIAGTNSYSLFDWLVEDILVSLQIPWVFAPISAHHAKISLGTAVGLGILLGMKPSGNRPQAGHCLVDYLRSLTDNPINLMITGHSLAGALSPSLALALQDTNLLWDWHNRASISVEPTAGPTPGNAAFAEYYDKKLGEQTARFYNILDVVPHAWNSSDLKQVKTLYEPDIPENPIVNAGVDCAIRISANGNYIQLNTSTPPFCSQVDTSIIKKWPLPAEWIDLFNFIKQMAYQHVTVYEDYFSLPGCKIESLTMSTTDDPKSLLSPSLIRAIRRAGISVPDELVRNEKEILVPPSIPIGNQIVELPSSPDDPQSELIVQQMTEELQQYVPKT